MDELTREQVEEIKRKVKVYVQYPTGRHDECIDDLQKMVATDAAQRARIEALEEDARQCETESLVKLVRERNELKAQLAAIQSTVGDTEFSLRSQLATLTIERDRLKEALEYYAQTAISARSIAALRGE